MILKYVTKNGMRIHEPPYTKVEKDEFYRRIGGGPITVARPASDRKAPNETTTTQTNNKQS